MPAAANSFAAPDWAWLVAKVLPFTICPPPVATDVSTLDVSIAHSVLPFHASPASAVRPITSACSSVPVAASAAKITLPDVA